MPAKPDDSVTDSLIAPTSRHRTLRVGMQPESLASQPDPPGGTSSKTVPPTP